MAKVREGSFNLVFNQATSSDVKRGVAKSFPYPADTSSSRTYSPAEPKRGWHGKCEVRRKLLRSFSSISLCHPVCTLVLFTPKDFARTSRVPPRRGLGRNVAFQFPFLFFLRLSTRQNMPLSLGVCKCHQGGFN